MTDTTGPGGLEHELRQERYERIRMQRLNVELKTKNKELRYERDLFRRELHRLHEEATRLEVEADDEFDWQTKC